MPGAGPDTTAEALRRGEAAAAGEAARRRRIARDMRAAREKLTSSSGLERAFDYELLRLFAQYSLGSAVPLMLLALAIASAATFWTPAGNGAVWCAGVLCATAILAALSRAFLRQSPDSVALVAWRRRFVLAELVHSGAWALAVQALRDPSAPATRIFVLFVLVMLAAATTMIAATVPFAAYAGLVPLVLATAWLVTVSGEPEFVILVLMAGSAQLFFLVLANRLYSSAVGVLQSRAEKDALFIELEQAKSNSDEARRRAEEANLAKSRFLATMSHELRTPLNAILGFSEVMKNEIFGPHSAPSYREYAGDIHGSGQHLLTLINEILDLSRIEAGRYELNEEAVHLADVVEDCRHMTGLRAKAKNQTVRETVEAALPRLWVDERAVRQIVLNVLSNAIKFTPPGGEITVKVGWTASGGQYLSVKDNGPGIPEDEIPTVMSSFGRGSLAIKTAEQGSGLGLPIVKGLVDLHGGGFQLRSRPREGTEVIVTFPAIRVMDALPAVAVEPGRTARAA